MADLPFFAFLLLSFSPLFVFRISSAFQGPDALFLTCGRSKSILLEDHRVFIPDSHFLPYRHLSGSKVETLDGSVKNRHPVLYRTARIFSNPASYKFEIKKKGTHLLRFHFYPFVSSSCDLSRARFHVVASGKVILLSDFEVGNSGKMAPFSRGCGFHMGRNRMDNNNNTTDVELVLKEYFLYVDSTELEITFVPADRSSFAFISAIEVTSAYTLIPDTVRNMASGHFGQLKTGMSKQEYEVLFRINTGGAKITPYNDTMWRNWVPDEDFLNSTAASMEKIHFTGPIRYREYGASPEIAPSSVYSTARVIKLAKLADAGVNNMTWDFSVPSDYKYLVRLHFCDIASLALNELYFDIYLNGRLAYQDFDLSTNSNGILASPYYVDFLTEPDSSGRLGVTIAAASKSSKPSKVNGMLNGLELMKLNNSDGNLDDKPMTMMMMDGDGGTPHSILVFARMFLTGAALVAIACAGYMLVLRWRSVSHTSAGWSPLPTSIPECSISLGSGGESGGGKSIQL